ncbi:hypothetical protein X777_03920 [Ooceraea biroi]|uniref:C2H2-type domain-containing protein n=1 Tax=Ooceraea biroi TaxID=2015173 RepID=A0A026WJ78_OOCBI|nr:hypothetical protein X777_03920 [Ooceraea biroi]
MRMAYFSLNKMHKYIRVHKDKLPRSSCSEVVYKVSCNDCEASYVGQTGRQVHTRIAEHRNNFKKTSTELSVLSEHRLQFNHDFDWENIKILDHESFLNKRLISEMIFIKRQKESLNLQTDTERLPMYYVNVIDRLKKI